MGLVDEVARELDLAGFEVVFGEGLDCIRALGRLMGLSRRGRMDWRWGEEEMRDGWKRGRTSCVHGILLWLDLLNFIVRAK